MKSIGIKYQLRTAIFIPVLIIALLFAVFYNGQFSRDLNQYNQRLGEAYIRQLLPAAQLALLREDKRVLQGLIDATAINPEVQSLAFYSASGKLLAYRGGKHMLRQVFSPPDFTGDYIESKKLNAYSIKFFAPITLPKINLYSFAPFKPPSSSIHYQSNDVLGWLVLNIDTQSSLIKRYQMYIVTIFITLLGLLIGLSVHYFLSKNIYTPINRLRRSMKQILRNEFETEISASSKGELGLIEQGCAHLQKQYLDMNHEVNQYIETATSDLQKNVELLEEKNIELSISKKKADEKNRQKSEFIANMSHEIRTPMNGVLGFTNVLLESELNPLQEDYVKTIKSSAQDLLSVINDILDFSKMDAGKLNLDCIPIDIRGCIDEVLSLLSPNAHKKGLDLIPSTETDVPKTVLGDPFRIKQIISNLVSNAIKFTNHGYVLIRTNVESENENEYTLSLSVTDTGVGIAPSEQENLFNAFNQADTSITRRYGGTGLGLVICKQLAEHMNGQISLSSEPDKGSTFTVRLQLAKLSAYEIEKKQYHRFNQLKILCFDDNPLHLEALKNGLGCWGIQCIEVDSFEKLQHAFEQHPDCNLAFLSINQGCEEKMSRLIQKTTIPCVFLSKWLIPNFRELGAKEFLFKPPNIQKLYEAVEGSLMQTNRKLPINTPEQKSIESLRKILNEASLSLLVAEDNPINLKLLSSLLGKNVKIETVNDGELAIQIGRSKAFDAILLDLQMPKKSGLEVAQSIRTSSMLNQETPILLISANNLEVNAEKIKSYGINDYLTKPVDEHTLINKILNVIEKCKLSAIEWSICLDRVSGNQELAQDFLEQFVNELIREREQFLFLWEKKSLTELEAAAHKLHGACCFCGVPQLQKQVAQFEKQTQDAQDLEKVSNSFSRLIKCIDDVIDEYERSFKF